MSQRPISTSTSDAAPSWQPTGGHLFFFCEFQRSATIANKNLLYPRFPTYRPEDALERSSLVLPRLWVFIRDRILLTDDIYSMHRNLSCLLFVCLFFLFFLLFFSFFSFFFFFFLSVMLHFSDLRWISIDYWDGLRCSHRRITINTRLDTVHKNRPCFDGWHLW